jgi:hypothetical protein
MLSATEEAPVSIRTCHVQHGLRALKDMNTDVRLGFIRNFCWLAHSRPLLFWHRPLLRLDVDTAPTSRISAMGETLKHVGTSFIVWTGASLTVNEW